MDGVTVSGYLTTTGRYVGDDLPLIKDSGLEMVTAGNGKP